MIEFLGWYLLVGLITLCVFVLIWINNILKRNPEFMSWSISRYVSASAVSVVLWPWAWWKFIQGVREAMEEGND